MHHAVAVDELLLHAGWCPVGFRRMFDQLEGIAELGMQSVWCVPHHRESAALQWPVRPEHRNDHVTAGPHGPTHLRDLGLTLLRRGHEMKNGPVMPDVVRMGRQGQSGDVSHQPSHPPGV